VSLNIYGAFVKQIAFIRVPRPVPIQSSYSTHFFNSADNKQFNFKKLSPKGIGSWLLERRVYFK
jgi:hypothetical protein